MVDVIYLILGLVVLFLSGKYLVVGGIELANFFKIPTLIVGLTIVSFGTSAPELLVSLEAAFSGHPDISLGNVIGSNIANIGLILGITAIIFPIPIASKLIKFDWVAMMIVSLILLAISFLTDALYFWAGLFLFLMLIYYNIHSISSGRRDNKEVREPKMAWYYSLLIVAISSVGLVFGAKWLVFGATNVARNLGVSERIISISLIAFGTSLPELATSVIAALRKETDISIGNIIGSNIFNVAGILGITAMVEPIYINKDLIVDMLCMIMIFVLLLVFMIGKQKKLSRFNGAILLLSYIAYMYFLIKY